MRETIIQKIISTLQPLDFVLALWQGGSAAHGYTDEWSDIDIAVVVEDDCVQKTFDIVEKTLAEIDEIELKYRVLEPAWHGQSQCFWKLKETPPFLLIDFAVFRRSSKNEFLEIERHGNVPIAFDKANLIVPPPLDKNQHFSQMLARFHELKIRFDLLQPLVKKEIYRGHLAEAIGNYHAWTLLPLVEVLGMIYRPYRYDFKLKYFSRDFPAEIVDRVTPLFCIANLEDLTEKQQLAESYFAEILPIAEHHLQNYQNQLN
ncbi:MAG: nucleotidyltransferase domain-containing protein [Oscillatoriaceae cyanobacterium Prado104]|jgi:predicted nucleotidyltransferase|nr:nucleotidyltransferase domain-containing protein [Oscillatoriaceae cyanobacterium Prado104]